MKMTVEQPQFLKSLQMIEHAVNERSALPILANVLLEAKELELILTATDLDVGVQYRLPLRAPAEQGAVTIPARRLATIVRELPDEPIVIETKQNHTTTLACGSSRFRLPGLPAEDFPIFPSIEQAQAASISQAHLHDLITHTAFAMSPEETRFVLNGALLKADKQTVTMVATDGRRLALATAAVSSQLAEPFSAVIPSKTVRELGRLLNQDGDGDAVQIAPMKDNQLVFHFGAATVITRLIEGQFPSYESVIPPKSSSVVTCRRQPLFDAVRRASLMTTATSQAVVFDLAKDKLVVSKESPEIGSAREEIPARYSGEPLSIAFNPEFWLDVLKVLPLDELSLEVSASDKPALIRLPDFTYIVLPMKLA